MNPGKLELHPRLIERFLAVKTTPAETLVVVRDLLRRCARTADAQADAGLEPKQEALLQRIKAKIAELAAELVVGPGELQEESLEELEKMLQELPSGALAGQAVILGTLAVLNVKLDDLEIEVGLGGGRKAS